MRQQTFMALIFALLGGLAVTVPVSAGYVKEVRDWFTYCSDSLVCTFETSLKGGAIFRFGFSRGSTANAPVDVFVVGAGTDGSNLRLTIDGEAENSFEFSAGKKDDNEAWRFELGAKQFDVLNAMMAGSSVAITVDDGAKRVTANASLSGFTGSALFVDDVQQNVGSRDALKAKGEAVAADATITAFELNASSELPVKVAEFWREHTDQCAEGYEGREDLIKELGGLRIEMEEGAMLYLLPCGLPGAYNYPKTALIHDVRTGMVRQLAFPIMSALGPTMDLTPFNINWDGRDRSLSSFYKGRGLGDCGTRAIWKIEGGFYANFVLVRQEQKDECDGNYQDWPVVWPVQ